MIGEKKESNSALFVGLSPPSIFASQVALENKPQVPNEALCHFPERKFLV